MALYELWDDRTGRSIGRWQTRSAALQVVSDLLERGDILAVAALVLRHTDWDTASTTIASGSQLVALIWSEREATDREGETTI